jgi:hypothetical protein
MRAGIALATALVICGVAAGPVLADRDDHHHGRRGWGQRSHERGWYGPRHFFYSSEPDVYYAPPPVVYTPPYPPPRINFLFPLWLP